MAFFPSRLLNLSNTKFSVITMAVSVKDKNYFPRLFKNLRPNFQQAVNLSKSYLNFPFFYKDIWPQIFQYTREPDILPFTSQNLRFFMLGIDPLFSTGFSRSGKIPHIE